MAKIEMSLSGLVDALNILAGKWHTLKSMERGSVMCKHPINNVY